MSRFNQRPENALKRANEFISVGKPNRALDTLYDVLKSKRNRTNATDKILEPIMLKYLELCVDLRKSHSAKEGLFQYRNMCQSTNVASLEYVVKRYLELADEKTALARKESNQAVLDVDDLDNIQTPEGILMKAVSGEDAQDRSDRTILMPWVKFLWESYRQCLELLRTNVRVESLYHYVARKAFSFCEEYKRKTEFRKLCDNLRLHLAHVLRQTGGPNAINLQQPETQQMNLETRLDQLDKAIKMELWTEAYKAIEDIHEFTVLSKKTPQPKMLANYYEKLSLVLWKAGNHLFHAAALLKLYQLSRNLKKNITAEELQELATRVLLATLAIPLPSAHPEFDRFFETEKSAMEKQQRLAQLLSLSQPPTRAGLVKDLVRYNVINHVHPQLRELYDALEVDFSPLKICKRVDTCLQHVATSEERLMKDLREYTAAVQDITLTRLLKQLAQIYTNIEFPRLLELSVFTDPFRLERVIVNAVRHNDMQIRIDQRNNCIHFGADLSESQREELEEGPTLQPMPSEVIRTQLINVSTTLSDFLSSIQGDERQDENEEIRARIVKQYLDSMARDRQRILSRQRIIEERKELMERLATEREVEEQRRQEQVSRHHLLAEQRRLEQERLERERLRQEEEMKAIQAKQIKDKIAQMSQTAHGQKVAQRLGAEIENLDPETLLQRQVEEIEKERREAANRLKSQEKKFDHLERAKRQEEVPLLQKELEARQVKDKELWEKEEKERVAHLIEERKIAVANKDRMVRMSDDKNKFLEMIKSQRHAEFEEKLKEWQSKVDKEREVRLAQRREQIIKERRERRKREREEMLRRQKEEEERKRKEQEEEEKRERLRREKEERDRVNRELDEKAKLQRQKEIEIEQREARERERRAQEESRGGGGRPGFRGDRDRERDQERQRERSPVQEDNWRRAPRPAPAAAAPEPYRPPHSAESSAYRPPHSRFDKFSKRSDEREPREDTGAWRRDRPREETGGGWRDERRGEPERRYDDRDRRDDRRDERREPERRMDDRDRREPDRRFEDRDRDRRDDRRYDDRRDDRKDRDFRDRDGDRPRESQDSWRRPQQSDRFGGDRDRPRDDRPPMRRGSPDRGGYGGDRRYDDRRDQPRRDDKPQGEAYRPPGRRGSPERGAYRAPQREASPPPRRVEEKPKEVEDDGWQTASSRKRR